MRRKKFFFSSKLQLLSILSWTVHRVLQTSLFNYFFIKNGFNDTIYIFKNYFTTVFLIFNKNKLYQNRCYTQACSTKPHKAPRVMIRGILSSNLNIGLHWLQVLGKQWKKLKKPKNRTLYPVCCRSNISNISYPWTSIGGPDTRMKNSFP